MPHHSSHCRLLGLLACVMLAPPGARAFEDAATGFAVNPPAPFSAEKVTNRNQFDVGVGIASTTGKPAPAGTSKYACEAGFKFAPANNKLSKAEINAFVETPEWVNRVRTIFETVFRIDAYGYFSLQGFRGVEFQTTPKAGPNAENVRMTLSMVETPKGRMTTVCGARKDEFETAVNAFRAVRDTIEMPE